jgi:hypothetical protein
MRNRPLNSRFPLDQDATLEALIRAACEVDALERGAGPRMSASGSDTVREDAGDAARPAGWQPAAPLKLRRIAVAAALAAAACLVLKLAIPAVAPPAAPGAPSLAGNHLAGVPLMHIEFAADAAPRDDRCVARFTGVPNEGGVLLALFRAWDRQCGCRTWRLYRWEDGDAVTRIRRDEALNIALDVSDMPPSDQLLVVAVASHPGDLPGDSMEAEQLLACLNSSPLEMQNPEDLTAFASAVEGCLPGASIVAHPFTTE